jgi:hypothetical protein
MRQTIRYGLLLLGASVLAACSGGAATTQSPNLTATAQAAIYTGPPPASADVQAFEANLWVNISGSNRCGNCHKAGGQSPTFAESDNINSAYQAALTVVNLSQPSQSIMVKQVANGHNCWLASNQACADIMTTWISNWASGSSGSSPGTQVQLQPPPDITVGATKVFPSDPTLFSQTVYPVVTQWCSRCHSDTAATPQSPFFASSTLTTAYANAQQYLDLNTPTNSMLYIRLAQQSHNCWGNPVSCPASAATMLAAIQQLANGITVTPIDPTLIVSKALTLGQGTVASGQGRYDAHVIAKWQFKEGSGITAYDTSGVDPSMDLTLNGNVTWDGGWGITLPGMGANAQASTATSSKLSQMIGSTGQYSIELWADPANVTQTKSDLVSYGASASSVNFSFAQDGFQYEAFGRSSATGLDGMPSLLTNVSDNMGMLAQAALQHIVITYDATHGRQLYVNGAFTGDVDKSTGGTLNNWDNSFAFVLGSAPGGTRSWQGTIRFAAIHNAALTQQQIQQNFAAGVGASYFLLFDVSSLVNVPQSYIMFTAAQYDNYSYLFQRPTFINLNSTWTPTSPIPIQGIRIGENGGEVGVDQAYITLNATVDAADYIAGKGQLLSPLGAVIPLQNGAANDQFFLTFAQIGSNTHTYTETAPTPTTPSDLAPSSDIGLRLWDELNATMAKSTQQALPNVYDISTLTSANNIAATQLAMQYCLSLVQDPTLGPAFFPTMNFSQSPAAAFGSNAAMDLVATPLIVNLIGQNVAAGITLSSQPSDPSVRQELYNLMTTLKQDPSASTSTIAAGACTAVLASGTSMLK